MKDLTKIFYPETIAVIGSSENAMKWGSFISSNILSHDFKGRFYPVSKSYDTIYGRKAYRSLKDIEDEIDLLIITTPAATVMEILNDCVLIGIKNIVLISSGFSETGIEGKDLELKLTDFAKSNGLNIVGPNTMGITNTKVPLHATGSHVNVKSGDISIIAQSGNIGTQIMIWAEQQDIGIGKFVGSGNEAVIVCEDYLEYFFHDKDTSVILMYIEGVDKGRKFFEIAKEATLRKPVIALKGGRTGSGSRAAESHTGAMAGSYSVFNGAMSQCGIICADSPSELLLLSAVFSCMPLPKGNNIGILTLGGGWGVITADECEERGLAIPQLPDDVFNLLDKSLPPFWSRGNPVDLVGQPDTDLFMKAIEAMVASNAFDAVIFLGVIGAYKMGVRFKDAEYKLGMINNQELKGFNDFANLIQLSFLDMVLNLMERYDKPIHAVSLVSFPEDQAVYSKEGCKYKVIIHRTPEEAVLCLEKQYKYSKYLKGQEGLK